jgi:hypothetical protein
VSIKLNEVFHEEGVVSTEGNQGFGYEDVSSDLLSDLETKEI